MLYELRLYQVTRGRIADQNERLTRHLPPLFARHGVRCVGAWNSLAGPASPRFVYLLAFESFEARERAWGGFYTDPDWAAARRETNAGHEMVERHDLYLLKPHPAWKPAPAAAPQAADALYELELQRTAPGQAGAATELLRSSYLPLLESHGAHTAGVFDMVSGDGMQQVVMVHAWPDAAAWHRGRTAAERAPAWLAELARQRQALGQPVFGRAEVDLLAAVEGFPVSPNLGL